jgi:hypothetical protein
MSNEQLLILVLPLVLTQVTQIVVLVFGFISNNRRLDSIERRLESIETKLDSHTVRIARLEERVSPIVRG